MRGVERRWRVVRRGFGVGGCGDIWWRERVEEGPEERRRGRVGWKERDVRAEGEVVGMSLRRCMSRTSGRSLRGPLVVVGWVRGVLDWRSLARG